MGKSDLVEHKFSFAELPITDEMSEDEKYVRREAEAWLNDVSLLSYWTENEHFDNIVKMGCKATPYVAKILRENDMYIHIMAFFSRVYPGLIEFEGYVGPDFVKSAWLQLYDGGILDCGQTPEVLPIKRKGFLRRTLNKLFNSSLIV